MATYLFAWNPKLWPWPELPSLRARAQRRGFVDVEWSSGRTRQIEVGSRAFMIRLGVPPKGVIGSGYTLTPPRQAIHWREEKAALGTMTNYIDLRLEHLLPDPSSASTTWRSRRSRATAGGSASRGAYLPESLADALEALWEERLAALQAAAPAVSKRPRRG